MTDREKVIKGLESLHRRLLDAAKRDSIAILDAIIVSDTLALLKAQEPKLVYVTANINRRKIGVCPNCGVMLNSGDYPNYCGKCGRAVKWE